MISTFLKQQIELLPSAEFIVVWGAIEKINEALAGAGAGANLALKVVVEDRAEQAAVLASYLDGRIAILRKENDTYSKMLSLKKKKKA